METETKRVKLEEINRVRAETVEAADKSAFRSAKRRWITSLMIQHR